MKILFLNYEYPPLGGGAANATRYLLREFNKYPELEVDLITANVLEKKEKESFGDNITIIRLPVGKDGKNLHFQKLGELMRYYFSAAKEIRRLRRLKKYDICFSFFTLPCGLLAYQFRKKIPYIVSLRGSDVPGYNPRFNLIYRIFKPLIKKIWIEAELVLANSRELARLAKKTLPELDLKIIYNGVDLKEFYPAQPSLNLSLGKGEKMEVGGQIKILTVSRLTKRKGIDYLLGAIKKLRSDQKKKVKLTIVGEGEEKENLVSLTKKLGLKDIVKFLGLVPHQNLPEIYRRHDIFVLSSLAEGMSNTLLEALASGLPVIASRVGGVKELVSDDRNGFIVPPKNAAAIKRSLIKFIENKGLIEEMGQRSRKKSKNFSWQKIAKEYIKLLKENMKVKAKNT